MKDEEILLRDLKKNGTQSSWDWEADLRFAVAVRDEETVKDIKDLLRSKSIYPHRIAFHKWAVGKLKRRRLRALQSLVNKDKVFACWQGTGECGVCDFGVNRVRGYTLR